MSSEVEAMSQEVQKLLATDEDLLYQELGVRVKAVQSLAPAALAAAARPDATFAHEPFMGPFDALADFGRDWLRRYEGELYAFACDPNDPEHGQWKKAFETGENAFATFVVGAVVAKFALLPAIAVVVATILARRFLRAGYQAACQAWKERLGA